MISLVKAIIGYCCAIVGKRRELRYGDILPAPKLSSSCRVLKYLSSRVLPKRLCAYLSFSNRSYLCSSFFSRSYSCLTRVSIDPRVKPEGDGREKEPEGDGREKEPEGDGKKKVIAPSRQARSSNFQVSGNKLIRRLLEFFALQKIGVTVLKIGRSLDDCLRNRGIVHVKNFAYTF